MGNETGAPQGILVAGTHSGCGKTTVSLALMAACARRGMKVQPFKTGPDFIDPGLHAVAAGQSSHTLDGWMLGRDRCRELFQRRSQGCDIAIVEGVMGLYDGASGRDECGSSAEMAKWLDLPVLLVVDARSMARSAAALVQGFAGFDPALRFAGVLFNRTGSERHRELLGEAMQDCPGVPVAGYLGRDDAVELPSRHLGLHTREDGVLDEARVAALAAWLERDLNLPRLLASCSRLPGTALPQEPLPSAPARPVRLGVARDKAFCFYYPENFRLLELMGAQLVFFSPMHDARLPENLDGLYFGGGYPELYAAELSANRQMRRAVHDFGQSGRPVYGECGGFMYLMQNLHEGDVSWPMAGLFAMECRMEPRLRSLGYREVLTRKQSLFGPASTMLRGHEFHYSDIIIADEDAHSVYKVMDRRGWLPETHGYMKRRVLGSYVHVHFGSNPEAAAAFLAACAESPPAGIETTGENT